MILEYEMDSTGSGQDLLAASCDHGDEPLDSVRGGQFLEKQSCLEYPRLHNCTVSTAGVI
jgi:hypothetical protein